MSRSTDEIYQDLKEQLQRRDRGFEVLCRAFEVNDNGSGIFNFNDFVEILGKGGIFLKRQELTKIYRQFDSELQEQLQSREFLNFIAGVESINYEESSEAPAGSQVMERVKNVLREKVRQKTVSGSSEELKLLRAFRHFDQDNTGYVNYDEFYAALERFGIKLQPDLSEELFAQFAVNGAREIAYGEFVAALYELEELSSSFVSKSMAVASSEADQKSKKFCDTGDMLINQEYDANININSSSDDSLDKTQPLDRENTVMWESDLPQVA